ncbi:hypothetical protein, partial [Fannyhessea vaginae]|uniref:hypothetical protein n=1 Tax=Fannyhessea vaginae TaxID=82135 RepID=UPI001FBB6021
FWFILENYPTLTRVSASIRRASCRRKKLRFPNAQVGALRHFWSLRAIAQNGNFWAQNACQSGVFF